MPQSPFFELLGGMAVCLLAIGLTWPRAQATQPKLSDPQFRARSLGATRVFDDFARMALTRSAESSLQNMRFERQLKQANWYWVLGEIAAPARNAPFWNLETLWTEKLVGALVGGAVGFFAGFFLLVWALQAHEALALGAAAGFAGALAYIGYTGPDASLASAARRRQKQISLEMGFRLPELRSDVLSGRTVVAAIREMAKRPGGPFVEELRRVSVALDILKDESAALHLLLDRNHGHELLAEFVNQMQMAITHGNEVNRVLNVLTNTAQQRLLNTINAQGRRNAQEMGRPLAMGSILILALLVMLPAALGIGDLLN